MTTKFNYDVDYPKERVTELENIIKTIFPDDVLRKFYLILLSTGLTGENIEKFIIGMSSKIGLNFNEVKNNSVFAIHPGGPKIIQFIKDILDLNEISIKNSEEILKKYGNMSSATLPHIWESVLNSNPKKGTFVYSLAFGPGLTISGSIMRIV